MARQGLLQVLRPAMDADYVTHFQRLAFLNLEIKREGPSRSRLLLKSQLEAAVGNYAASRTAAADALVASPEDGEAHYQMAASCLLVALSHAGVTEWPLSAPEGSLRGLLEESHAHLGRAVASNPDDTDAQELADAVGSLLARCRSEDTLRGALRRARRCAAAPNRPERPVRDG